MARVVVFVNNLGSDWVLDELNGRAVSAFGNLDVSAEVTDDEMTHAIQSGLGLEFVDGVRFLRINGVDKSALESFNYGNLAEGPDPAPHAFGGSDHTPSTLSDVNSKISDDDIQGISQKGLSSGYCPLDGAAEVSNTYHGNRSGGALHALVTPAVDGFMSAVDKTKLNGVASGATNTPLSGVVPQPVDRSAGLPGAAFDASKSDHKHDISTAAPVSIGTSNQEGLGTDLARASHVHNHDNQAGGTLHAVVVSGVSNGFMTAADKAKLDGVAAGADVTANNPPQAHKNSHKLLGGDAFVSTDLLDAVVRRLRETSGPTDLLMGAVANGEVLQRSGTDIVGAVVDTKIVNTITTNGNAWTSISTIPIPDNTAVMIRALAVGRRTDAAGRGGYIRWTLVYREAGGGATLEGAEVTPFSRDSTPAYDAQITVVGNDALLQVRGAVGHTMNWRSEYTLDQVS
jgi:hypothetical protein